MVTFLSFIAFFIVGVMWGASDAFMEISSHGNETGNPKNSAEGEGGGGNSGERGVNGKDEYEDEGYTKKKNRKRLEIKLETRKIKKMKRANKKSGNKILNILRRKKNDSLEEEHINDRKLEQIVFMGVSEAQTLEIELRKEQQRAKVQEIEMIQQKLKQEDLEACEITESSTLDKLETKEQIHSPP